MAAKFVLYYTDVDLGEKHLEVVHGVRKAYVRYQEVLQSNTLMLNSFRSFQGDRLDSDRDLQEDHPQGYIIERAAKQGPHSFPKFLTYDGSWSYDYREAYNFGSYRIAVEVSDSIIGTVVRLAYVTG